MRRREFVALTGGVAAAIAQERSASKPKRDYPIQPVPFTDVHFTDRFWAPRIEVNRAVTIPFAFQQCQQSGRVNNFERAAAVLRGENISDRKPPGYPFDDTDLYKVIEGASYTLSVHPDKKLESYLDEMISKIAAAQEKDGYLYTTRTIDPKSPHPWAGKSRWELEQDDSHELYNLGHLYEAAVAHYQATKKRSLLDVALKTADLLDTTFGPGKQSIWPGHQITEMGLVKLYRQTGDERYLRLARFLLDQRGPDSGRPHNPRGLDYNQAHKPVVQQTEAVGHAVRATYMYSGMADVAALTGDASYAKALNAIWQDVVTRKLYITGGIGARGSGEAFGAGYELPNMTAYNETCASIGSDYWNFRMFLLEGDGKYIDVMERTLYNGLLSGVSLDGKSFFYPNPLESAGQHARSPWFGVACCPGNMTRFLASVPGYMYAHTGDSVYVNLFATSAASIQLDNCASISLKQQTSYPWDGAVAITVEPKAEAKFTMKLRIPGWARNEAVPSDLYRFADTHSSHAELKVNGRTQPINVEKGYAAIARTWAKGDAVELLLPMPVRRVVAHDKVAADTGRVALQRGPLMYAAEWPDNPKGRVRNLVLPDASPLKSEFRKDLLGGVQVVTAGVRALSYDASGKVLDTEQELTAIPYYAWANRGRGEMIVWLARDREHATPAPWPTVATKSKVTTSGRTPPQAINDGIEPANSADPTFFFDWWPRKGTNEWVEYEFAEPATLSTAAVYWFDDTGRGEVRVPQSWRLLYRSGSEWTPVEGASEYGVAKDRYNQVTFRAVTTNGLRLEVTMQPRWSAGIQEWKVN